ncbi:glycosyltransferase [Chaetomidium leptoderma]|uniref:Dol-P-Glc:Glc(2)Man(9)GlcNAc(2)-PP-Dol alpha-1,2-glucosyltransferase n=1 Tax=Chaetomidium leptoderma TaxID=669021 RepID=A0AAN6VS51_9PEZI|nr:glycosyltransferase [Chaetomidium leptoderma]
MEVVQTLRASLTFAELRNGLGIAFILGRFLTPSSKRGLDLSSPSFRSRADVLTTAGFFALFLGAKSWLALVNKSAPEPYLVSTGPYSYQTLSLTIHQDEVFHIPQAQTYCSGHFWDWDDKITTPPGLYLLSVAYHKWWMSKCTPLSLRSNNVLATLLTALLASQCRHLIEVRGAEREGKKIPRSVSFYSYHTGINIALFPVIFFFSALYYTDVVSTLVVLVAYRNHLLRLAPERPGLINDLWTVALGVAALFMRQTNVFWVVVYMGGLEAVHVLRTVMQRPGAQGYLSKLHDPPLPQSSPEDWLLGVLTIAVTALCNPIRVLRQIWPHVTVIALFAGFVAWNGGVVLGDKSNHVATIHLAQMLYIWPLFAFFSAPLLVSSFISAVTHPTPYLQSLLSCTTKRATLASIPYTLLTLVLSLAVVQYNTIIHPFTLADNRHYMFYIFRYTILRSPLIRLSLVPVYTLCRWVLWDQLTGTTTTNNPTPPAPAPAPKPRQTPKDDHTPPAPAPAPAQLTLLDDPISENVSSTPPPTTTALLWLLTTALSLVTAPLVEPRYFILPWVFYRLLVPSWSVAVPKAAVVSSQQQQQQQQQGGGRKGTTSRFPAAWFLLRRVDVRLVLETVWFVVVNVGTMYMFLFRPFYWRGEDGGVGDGGRVQRFMW